LLQASIADVLIEKAYQPCIFYYAQPIRQCFEPFVKFERALVAPFAQKCFPKVRSFLFSSSPTYFYDLVVSAALHTISLIVLTVPYGFQVKYIC
jgi:hypothetical protein